MLILQDILLTYSVLHIRCFT